MITTSMDTGLYIKELLYRYECVIVPNFGAFLTKRQSATIDTRTHTFTPPSKSISFNSQLQTNDGVLANYIVQAEAVSYPDAVAKIARYVAKIQGQITEGKRVILDDIGAFYSAVENTLQFEPLATTNYLTDSFGLHSFASPAIERVPQREVYKEEVVTLEETTPIAFTPERRESNNRPYLKYAAIAVIALGIGGFMGLKSFSDANRSHNTKISQEVHAAIENKIQTATFEITNPLPAITVHLTKAVAYSNTKKYHIVAGAFRIAANAQKKAAQLSTKGFNAKMIGVNAYGLHQVVYDSYTTRQEAITQLRAIKKDQDLRAWLLIDDLSATK